MDVSKILIGGEFVSGSGRFEVRNPYSGEIVATVAAAGPDAARRAIRSSESAADEMRALPRYRRRQGIENISRAISDRSREFAETIVRESGKPMRYAVAEVDRAIATFRIAAAEAERFCGEVVAVDISEAGSGRSAQTRYMPRGVIFGITPFNFPLNLVAHKVAPALASGNAIIIKPSDKTPLSSLLLADVFQESGLPDSALQVVPMEIETLNELLGDERIKMISFTGSDKVGWMLREKYPRKAFALELGGNAPVIVDETADLSDAAERITTGAFAYSGQVCISVQRILMAEAIRESLTAELVEMAQSLKYGDPLEEATDVSSMISKEAARNTIEVIEKAVEGGAEILCGGRRDGAYVEPTLISGVTSEMSVVTDEIFAPVATVEGFGDISEAVAAANSSRFGLQAGLFSNSLSNIEMVSDSLRYGGVIVNDVPTFRVDNMPYGGMKDSGVGREGVRYAMEDMSEIKVIVTRSG